MVSFAWFWQICQTSLLPKRNFLKTRIFQHKNLFMNVMSCCLRDKNIRVRCVYGNISTQGYWIITTVCCYCYFSLCINIFSSGSWLYIASILIYPKHCVVLTFDIPRGQCYTCLWISSAKWWNIKRHIIRLLSETINWYLSKNWDKTWLFIKNLFWFMSTKIKTKWRS